MRLMILLTSACLLSACASHPGGSPAAAAQRSATDVAPPTIESALYKEWTKWDGGMSYTISDGHVRIDWPDGSAADCDAQIEGTATAGSVLIRNCQDNVPNIQFNDSVFDYSFEVDQLKICQDGVTSNCSLFSAN
jgi:hypothetical protein